MKKALIALLCTMGIFFSACSKKEYGGTNPPTTFTSPSLKKDTSMSDRFMKVPKTDTVLYSGTFNVASARGLVAIGAKINFVYTGAFKPADDLQNVYFVIKDGSTVIFQSNKKMTVPNSETSFDQFAKNLLQTKSYIIEVHADVLATATDGIGATDECTVSFQLIFQSAEVNGDQNTGWVPGQKITFSNGPAALSSAVQISQVLEALDQTILGNQEFEVSKIDMVSTGGSSILNQIRFSREGDPGLVTAVTAIKVFDGVTLIGSANFTSSGFATVNLNLNLVQDVTKTLSVKVVVGPINSANQSSSMYAVTFSVGIPDFMYTDAGSVNKTGLYGLPISNKLSILKSNQTITSVPLSGNLQNGVVSDLAKFTVTSNTVGSTADKQFSFDVSLVDNGTHLDTLSLITLSLKINNVVATNVRFTNTAGQIIDSISSSDARVYVTFVSGTQELVVPAGTTATIALSGKLKGFNHPLDGDVASIKLVTIENQSSFSSYRYVNSGVVPNNLNAKLWSSPTANAGAVLQNLIWSDLSDPAHSFVFGAGTADAKNGTIGIIANVTPQVWVQ